MHATGGHLGTIYMRLATSRMQNLHALVASTVQSRQFFASMLPEQLFRVRCGSDRVRCGSDRVQCGSDRVQWSSDRVRCGSDRVQCGSDRVRCGSDRVLCGSDSSVLACCTAGLSLNLGSAPQRRPSTERKAMRTTRVVLYEYYI